MKRAIGLLLLSIFCCIHSYAQNDSIIPIGFKVKIYSKVLNEERNLNISLPNSYKTTKKEYPLLIFTDGEDNYFIRTAGMVKHYNYYHMPEMIVIGIPNTNRERDLFPYFREQMPTSGGGDVFLRFITDELIPYIDSNYRTTTFRTLAGESAGGLLTMYALFVKPDMFDAYIASAPAIGIGYEKLAAAADQQLSNNEPFYKNYLFHTMKRI